MNISQIYAQTEDQIDKLLLNNQKLLSNSIKKLENNIIDKAADKLSIARAGDIKSQRTLSSAVQYHKSLIKEFKTVYEDAAIRAVDGFNKVNGIISKEFKGLDIPLSFTTADKDMFNALHSATIDSFQNLGNDALNKIAQSTYDAVLVGRSFAEYVDNIKSVLAGGQLERYASLKAHDSLMNYYTRLNVKKAADADIDTFLYYGNIIRDSRPFCVARAGKVFTLEQIQEMDGMSWTGKAPGLTLINRGGYNCRHSWHPVRPEWIEDGQIEVQRWPAEGVAFAEVIPTVELGAITSGSKVSTAQDILYHYEISADAAYGGDVTAGELKKNISKRLGERMESLNISEWNKFKKEFSGSLAGTSSEQMSADTVDNLIRQWACTSGDNNPPSIMMQLAAEKEFGLKGSSIWWDKTALAEAQTLFKTHEVAARRFLREMYNDTQTYLKKQGLKTVRVARGYIGDTGIAQSTRDNLISKINIKLQPMSSFSSDMRTARSFAIKEAEDSAIFFADIPVNRVLSCPVTGYGCESEFEYVVLGSQKTGGETVLVSSLKRWGESSWSNLFGSGSEFNKNITNAIYGATK